MTTWILDLGDVAAGLRVAIKDLIDVRGLPTTGGSRLLAAGQEPSAVDAACLAGLRAAKAVIAGKTNLHELGCGSTGVNPHFGTPRNPFDPRLIPGGSSSGNAVALAAEEVDLALGTDTAGSIRTPSACCGTVGLKTTWGRIPNAGVWPLAPSLDVVGPMARDVAGVIVGMELLDDEWRMDLAAATTVGRVRLCEVAPGIDEAIDTLLAHAELEVVEVPLPGWETAERAAWTVLLFELWQSDSFLFERDPGALGSDVRRLIEMSRKVSAASYHAAIAHRMIWQAELAAAFSRAPVLVWPTISYLPPPLDAEPPNSRRTNLVVNFSGHPALALPVPTANGGPTSLQLVGPDAGEAALCATGLVLEGAALALS
jgi:amidase